MTDVKSEPQEPSATPSTLDDLGLSIDMLDADRLREWARLLLVHGADISHWASVPYVAGKMQTIATEIEKAVRDIGVLRAALRPSEGPPLSIPQVDLPADAARVLKDNLWALYESEGPETKLKCSGCGRMMRAEGDEYCEHRGYRGTCSSAALREGPETGRPPVESFDLGPIKAREAAATKGPWGSGPLGAGYQAICFYADGSWNNDLLCSGNNQADAEFCAKARLDIPALIAEVERLRALPAGPETGDRERLLELANVGALQNHIKSRPHEGHDSLFSVCPHRDCVLVRQAAPAASEGQK